MPAPKPQKGEDRDHYMGRCVPFFVNEGRPQQQAVAICISSYERAKSRSATVAETLARIVRESPSV